MWGMLPGRGFGRCSFTGQSRPSGWLRAVTALTSRRIFLAGVKWSCLRINKPAFPSYRWPLDSGLNRFSSGKRSNRRTAFPPCRYVIRAWTPTGPLVFKDRCGAAPLPVLVNSLCLRALLTETKVEKRTFQSKKVEPLSTQVTVDF